LSNLIEECADGEDAHWAPFDQIDYLPKVLVVRRKASGKRPVDVVIMVVQVATVVSCIFMAMAPLHVRQEQRYPCRRTWKIPSVPSVRSAKCLSRMLKPILHQSLIDVKIVGHHFPEFFHPPE